MRYPMIRDDDVSMPIVPYRGSTNEHDVEITRLSRSADIVMLGMRQSHELSMMRAREDAAESIGMIQALGSNFNTLIQCNPGRNDYDMSITDHKWFGKRYSISARVR